ncbi:hypothetical protein PIROE2DRAFT_1400 [Piromyces sp. E2]|nr:hypothetical protein PIROE2DRAFT_1400 [Piromyces sp. E2]|eukprot:OUM70521.1 hypothetical protein PIROE2DRAFT_1400 [Piromyces sp. E2]
MKYEIYGKIDDVETIKKKQLVTTIIILIAFTIFYAILCYIFYKRIKFSKEVLNVALLSIKRHRIVPLLNLITTFLGIIINTVIVATLYGIVSRYENKKKEEMESSFKTIYISEILIIAFLLFSYYFLNEIVKNVIHVTISGTTTYYLKRQEGEIKKNPIISSFKKSLHNRFGSICFGSLLNTFIRRLDNIITVASYVTIPIIFVWTIFKPIALYFLHTEMANEVEKNEKNVTGGMNAVVEKFNEMEDDILDRFYKFYFSLKNGFLFGK